IHGSMANLHELARSSNLQNKYFIYIPKVGEEIAFDAVPDKLSATKLAEMELPTQFEIPLEAEVEGGWLRVPEAVVNDDPRWKALTDSGLLKAKWVGERLVLSRLKNPGARNRAAQTHPECCANCHFLEVDTCLGTDSPLWGAIIDPNGKCDAFRAASPEDLADRESDEGEDGDDTEGEEAIAP
ncbi:MAG: hypothetical protein WCD18_10705, partial [Thermosynechococcaceae cyanobacterium]